MFQAAGTGCHALPTSVRGVAAQRANGGLRQMALPSQGPLPSQAGLPSNAFNCPPFKRMSVHPSGSRRIKAKNILRRNGPKPLKLLGKSAKTGAKNMSKNMQISRTNQACQTTHFPWLTVAVRHY
jgi:hypothetical protein